MKRLRIGVLGVSMFAAADQHKPDDVPGIYNFGLEVAGPIGAVTTTRTVHIDLTAIRGTFS